jgi:GNAT superfamily N-acetyltransferase
MKHSWILYLERLPLRQIRFTELSMSDAIAVIPPARWSEALDLLLTPLADAARGAQKAAILAALAADSIQEAGLLGHFRGDALTAALWLQSQVGHTATLWPPVASAGVEAAVTAALVDDALDLARSQGAVLVQSLLLTDAGDDAQALREAGFVHAADLLYLVSLSGQFPRVEPENALTFVPQTASDLRRISAIVERSYEGTRDCPSLNGVRTIEDVIAGYRSIGRFRPDLWLIARTDDGDAGCVILVDHAPEPTGELVYMGVVPERRGRGLGLEITRYAQWICARESMERLALAVDASNEPALAMYAAAGFVSWDRRSVFVRVL